MNTTPKVLLFDLETSPNIAYVWGKYEQNVIGDFLKERMIISVAWKWLNEKTVHASSIPDYYGYKPNPTKNKKLIEKIHSLFMSADILVGQNGDNFDIKRANAAFIEHGLMPPHPHKTIDTLKVARAKFDFNSNKLDDLGAKLGLGRKLKTGGFDLWKGCLDGDKASWAKMVEYNKQDVVLLEKIYLKFRPWIKNHPNMNVFDASNGCSSCKSTKLRRRGFSMTKKGRRQQYQCLSCGAWMTGEFTKAG